MRRQKTDRRDAGELAHQLWVHRQQFLEGKHPLGVRRVQLPTPQEAEDRQVDHAPRRLTRKRTAVLNGIHKLLRKHNLEQSQPTEGFKTKKVRKWLEKVELPPMDRMELDLLLPQWELLEEQLKAVNAKIAERAEADEQVLLHGDGAGAWATTARGHPFPHRRHRPLPAADSLANYFGLTPGCRNSGEATKRLGSITKRRQPGGALPPEPGGDQGLALRRHDAGVVPADQETPRRQDREGRGDAAPGDDPLAHAQAEGTLPLHVALARFDHVQAA